MYRIDCKDCEYFKLRVRQQAITLYASRDGKEWQAASTVYDITAFQGGPNGGFPPVKLAVFTRGKGNVRIDDFVYEALH
ncbi:MAG: hypothetical protein U5J83_01065 [Bryobacterales bacterium]|nr:hypothetical protein [Bryobacterales bacterium]